MLVVYDDHMTAHLATTGHPEQPDRVRVVAGELERRGMLGARMDTVAAPPEEIARVHPRRYIDLVRRECARLETSEIGELSTGDTTIDAGSYDAASRAAGGTLAALDRVCAEGRGAFALVRPPGHHAEPARGMGFCVFNNAALAARSYHLATGGAAIVADIDYHHGNGTQALVGRGLSYLSTHADPAYPGTGFAVDNHIRADGSLMNVPLPESGVSTEAFVAIWTRALRMFAKRVRPGLIVVSAGYDYIVGDPVGDLGVAESSARQIGRIVREVADEYCGGRALFVLEGGYVPRSLARCVAETIHGFEESETVEPADVTSIPMRQQKILGDFESKDS